ncbi:hypothetical protein [Terriglobus saanensis]|uniref:Uncharacterized protein n=1 Tax=Terriglobus saanensis (strain ATCC BAA-1853 / DSM 23119 / SP1PR4) TaxID=401053 RepID=E8UXE2_TERSS|nr:hypothetical protein [Terriglobus saanensis]ADV84166.1 hypothetical protein AciPR4_3412 [Terriglobus saanensis SP1PR4]
MSTKACLDLLGMLEIGLSLAAIFYLVRSESAREYWSLTSLLSVRVAAAIIGLTLDLMAGHLISGLHAYVSYFFVYWIGFGIETLLGVLTIYSIYRSAMAPLKGLQTLGMLMFKWAAAISTVVALAISIGPRVRTTSFLISAVSQMQRASSVLTLSLLLFVCFAIRPMGLSYRSRIFGVSLGLGVISTLNMIQSAWLTSNHSLYTVFNFVDACAVCATLGIWIRYFAMPEPARRMILLPTTSPFLRWNQISEILGHNPGFVAVGGLPPGILAPAELEIMRRASAAKTASASASQMVSASSSAA